MPPGISAFPATGLPSAHHHAQFTYQRGCWGSGPGHSACISTVLSEPPPQPHHPQARLITVIYCVYTRVYSRVPLGRARTARSLGSRTSYPAGGTDILSSLMTVILAGSQQYFPIEHRPLFQLTHCLGAQSSTFFPSFPFSSSLPQYPEPLPPHTHAHLTAQCARQGALQEHSRK